ncbi:MAG: hypothetical protein AB1679_26505, partial [Actinomycetota bacterium]
MGIKGVNFMMSRRLVVVLTAGLTISAACGGSAEQREALRVQSQNAAPGGGSAAPGAAELSGDAGA